MALAEAKCPEKDDMQRLQKHVDWLINARVLNGKRLEGWNYTNQGPTFTDGSNTQYALLALWSASRRASKSRRSSGKRSATCISPIRAAKAAWQYSRRPIGDIVGELMTMTTAGVSGLLIAGAELNPGREVFRSADRRGEGMRRIRG